MESSKDFLGSALSDEPLCDQCSDLMMACAALDFFPREDVQMRSLIGALHEFSSNHDHAKTVISIFLKSSTAAPKVADIYRIADESRPVVRLPEGCEVCKGDPTVPVDPENTQAGYDRCSCARGDALRKMDREREREKKRASVTVMGSKSA